jgi:hypothetical protein
VRLPAEKVCDQISRRCVCGVESLITEVPWRLQERTVDVSFQRRLHTETSWRNLICRSGSHNLKLEDSAPSRFMHTKEPGVADLPSQTGLYSAHPS